MFKDSEVIPHLWVTIAHPFREKISNFTMNVFKIISRVKIILVTHNDLPLMFVQNTKCDIAINKEILSDLLNARGYFLLYGTTAPSSEFQHPEAWPASTYGQLREGYLRMKPSLARVKCCIL